MATPIVQPIPTQFPATREVTLKLQIGLSSEEDRDYFIDSDGNPQLGLLADLYDALDYIHKHIITINGKSYAELQRALQADITS